MSNLLLPNQQPNPPNAIKIEIGNDGSHVLIKLTIAIPLQPDDAIGLATALANEGHKIKHLKAAVMAPINCNGLIQ